MVISIEGMDGAGKTTISKEVAKRLGFEYKMQTLGLSKEQYRTLCERIESCDNDDVKAMFFGFINMLNIQEGLNKNIIIDKHILATYFWNGNFNNEELFKFLIKMGIIPDLTFILFATVESRVRHISFRNVLDKDLISEKRLSFGYDKMCEFALKYNMPFVFINTEGKDLLQIISQIESVIMQFVSLNESEKKKLIDSINQVELYDDFDVFKLIYGGV